MQDTLELVCEAIRDKKQIVATYQGHVRVMCPHVVGHKNGKLQALFYQCGGTSSSGLEPVGSPRNWRCIPLVAMTDVAIQEGEWATGNDHTQRQTCVDRVIEEVAY